MENTEPSFHWAPMYAGGLHAVSPAPREGLRGCFSRERGFEISFSAARPRPWAAMRYSGHSDDDPIPWWIIVPAAAGKLSLMIAGELHSLTAVSLPHPSPLFFFFSANTDTIRCARTHLELPKRSGGFGNTTWSSELVDRPDLRGWGVKVRSRQLSPFLKFTFVRLFPLNCLMECRLDALFHHCNVCLRSIVACDDGFTPVGGFNICGYSSLTYCFAAWNL